MNNDKRWMELDALRGFAVLGIFWVNIIYFGWPYEANLYPTLFGGDRELNILSWTFIHLLVEGAMFALFSMLFGAGALMLLNERRLATKHGLRSVDHYYRRNLWLIGFGLLHAFVLLWPLEILFTYGVLGLALFPLRKLGPTILLLAGVLLFTWGTNPLPDLISTLQPPITTEEPSPASLPLRDDELLAALDKELESISDDMLLYHSGYKAIFLGNIDIAVGQQTANLYEDNIWDAGGMMLVGMALFKWGVLNGQRALIFYLLLSLIGFSVAVILRLPAVMTVIGSGFDPDQIALLGSVPSLLGRLPLALGYIGLIMLICRWSRMGLLVRGLAATGRMAFTHYVTQTLFAIILFYGFGFGLFGRLPFYQLLLIALLFGGAQMLASIVWLRHFQQGPLEWLWRTLVHLKRQPFRRLRKDLEPNAKQTQDTTITLPTA